jgi:hypothetical protein
MTQRADACARAERNQRQGHLWRRPSVNMTIQGFIESKACVIFKMVYAKKIVVWRIIMEKTTWRDIGDV